MTFAQFWPEYVRAHSRAATRVAHLIGTLTGWMLAGAAIAERRWWWIVLALVRISSIRSFTNPREAQLAAKFFFCRFCVSPERIFFVQRQKWGAPAYHFFLSRLTCLKIDRSVLIDAIN